MVDGHTVLDSTRGKLLHESNIRAVYYAPVRRLRSGRDGGQRPSHALPVQGRCVVLVAEGWRARARERRLALPRAAAAGAMAGGPCGAVLGQGGPVATGGRARARAPARPLPPGGCDGELAPRDRKVKGTTVAASDRPKMLFETSVPPRPYLLRADVLPGVLEPSATTSTCPYKGDATYWHVRTPAGLAEDAAWSYETPLPDAGKAIGHVSFAGDDVEVELS